MQGKLEGLRAIVTAVAVAVSAVVGAAAANAADPAQNAGEKESKGSGPDFSVNATYTSDYRFRGFTQTREKPALQGGLDAWRNLGYPMEAADPESITPPAPAPSTLPARKALVVASS